MDRKAWIAIILCLAGMFAWQWWYQKEYGEALSQQRAARAAAAAQPEEIPSPTPATPDLATVPGTPPPRPFEIAPVEDLSVPQLAAPVPVVPPDPESPAQTTRHQTAALEMNFTTRGGGIEAVALRDHEAERGERVMINETREIPIGAIGIRPEDMGRDRYELVSDSSREIVFEGRPADGLRVVKRFFPPEAASGAEAYLSRLEITFENTGDQPLQSSGYFIAIGSIIPVHERDLITYTGIDYFTQGKTLRRDVNWFTASRIPLLGIETRGPRPFLMDNTPALEWAAVKNQYFTSILRPIDGLSGGRVWATRFDLPADEVRTARPGIEGALGIGGFEIAPGGSVTHRFDLYTGPKKYGWLKSLGGEQEAVLGYGVFKWVSITLLSGMNGLYKFLGSYALAIIVLTLIIKCLLWPLQNKATNSMRKMAALSPKMKELREKYKDDPTRMNQELMKLYKDYGVNPFGGCLPMLVQIPIFFGFYSMLGSTVELRNSSFLWVQDLSQPDTIFRLGPMPVNVLPLVMAATMVWQMKVTPKTGDAVQQRIFMFLPLIFLLFCYNFAAALSLYWTVQNLFSIVQLYLTRDKPLPALHKVVPAEPEKKKKKKR